jgi:aminopeptidase N
MVRSARAVVAVLAALAVGSGSPVPVSALDDVTAVEPTPAVHDPYYPKDGNPGYDVTRYFPRLRYVPGSHFTARTTITAVAVDRLESFRLDLGRTRIFSVTVDDRPAGFARRGAHELVVTPAEPVRRGHRFTTVVAYRGPTDLTGTPDGSAWLWNADAALVLGEPHSCTSWYPCNDHPSDKAKFRVTVTLPRPLEAVSVGARRPTSAWTRADGTRMRTFRWVHDQPTATYLTTLAIDDLTLRSRTLRDGTRVVDAYGEGLTTLERRERRLPEVLRVLSRRWGDYPFAQAGGIFPRFNLSFSLETVTRPTYAPWASLTTIAHENGHQWWGDNVSIRRWRDICLNECLASYSEWIWQEHRGADLDRRYRRGITDAALFAPPLYDMGAGNEFHYGGVYLKGKYFVHALRHKIGSRTFFAAMRAIQRHWGRGNLSMLGLRDALEARTGVGLHRFWREWVLETGRPSPANLHPGDL